MGIGLFDSEHYLQRELKSSARCPQRGGPAFLSTFRRMASLFQVQTITIGALTVPLWREIRDKLRERLEIQPICWIQLITPKGMLIGQVGTRSLPPTEIRTAN
jgi:hypothetical protein